MGIPLYPLQELIELFRLFPHFLKVYFVQTAHVTISDSIILVNDVEERVGPWKFDVPPFLLVGLFRN